MNHTPTLLECFAANEAISDEDIQHATVLVPDKPEEDPDAYVTWEAKWRAKLRFIRAKAMTEEAERIRSTEITRQSDGTQKKTGLSFSEALDAMKSGKSVRRNEWVPGSIAMVNGRFKDSADPIWGESIYSNDILANDWEIVE